MVVIVPLDKWGNSLSEEKQHLATELERQTWAAGLKEPSCLVLTESMFWEPKYAQETCSARVLRGLWSSPAGGGSEDQMKVHLEQDLKKRLLWLVSPGKFTFLILHSERLQPLLPGTPAVRPRPSDLGPV